MANLRHKKGADAAGIRGWPCNRPEWPRNAAEAFGEPPFGHPASNCRRYNGNGWPEADRRGCYARTVVQNATKF